MKIVIAVLLAAAWAVSQASSADSNDFYSSAVDIEQSWGRQAGLWDGLLTEKQKKESGMKRVTRPSRRAVEPRPRMSRLGADWDDWPRGDRGLMQAGFMGISLLFFGRFVKSPIVQQVGALLIIGSFFFLPLL